GRQASLGIVTAAQRSLTWRDDEPAHLDNAITVGLNSPEIALMKSAYGRRFRRIGLAYRDVALRGVAVSVEGRHVEEERHTRSAHVVFDKVDMNRFLAYAQLEAPLLGSIR